MKEYQCGRCGTWLSGYNNYINHTCGRQTDLNNIIDGLDNLKTFEYPDVESTKTIQTKVENFTR